MQRAAPVHAKGLGWQLLWRDTNLEAAAVRQQKPAAPCANIAGVRLHNSVRGPPFRPIDLAMVVVAAPIAIVEEDDIFSVVFSWELRSINSAEYCLYDQKHLCYAQ